MWPEDGNLSNIEDAELEALETELVNSFNDLANGENPSDDDIAELSEVRDHITAVRGERGSRAEASAARAEQIAALATEVNGSEGDDENGEGTEGEGEADTTATDDDPANTTTGDEGTNTAEEGTQSGGSTSGGSVTAGATVAQAQRRQPARTRPRQTANDGFEGSTSIIAAADVPNTAAGSTVRSSRQLAEMMVERHRTMGRGNGDNVPVATFQLNTDNRRHLGYDDNVYDRMAEFNQTPQGILAAGGLCAPTASYYRQMILSEADRPVRDALANFTADRGGIRYNPPPTLADVAAGTPAAVGIVTAAQDAANAQKTCFTVNCNAPVEVTINAIYNCLTFGNFGARAFPEQVQAWQDLALAWQARLAETMLLDGIAAGSTTVTAQGLVGAAREILAILGRASAAYRNRHRMAPGSPLRVLLPAWAADLIRADVARGWEDDLDALALADASINSWLAARGLNVTWYLDGKTGSGQVFGQAAGGQTYTDFVLNSTTTVTSATAGFTSADVGRKITATGIPTTATIASVTNPTTVVLTQAATATASGVTGTVNRPVLQQFPGQVFSYMYAEGTWLHLDGGTLDLGLVRDSALNKTNQFQIFSESFENVAKVGPESLEIVMNLVPDGTRGASKAIVTPINV